MCYGDIGIFRGFIVRENVKVPLIEINGEVREMMIPIADNVKVGDKIMVYNSYNFDYEFKAFNLGSVISSLIEKLKKLSIPLLRPNISVVGA